MFDFLVIVICLIVCGVRLENIPHFDIAAFALRTFRASDFSVMKRHRCDRVI
ncbi:MAG: hypothetical protein [Olavius algarvensis Delta 4 endosymbiont]|nr:MAG: hypothetical protein [Olavius algarvensis Delta 4 endosymbiont]